MIRRCVLILLILMLAACDGPGVVAPTAPPPSPTAIPPTSTPQPTIPPQPQSSPQPTLTLTLGHAFAPIGGNPTVPPTQLGDAPTLALNDLPTIPDALTIDPGDRFSIQTTPSAPAEVEAFYTEAFAGLGLTLSDRQENVSGLFGDGLLLAYTGGGVTVYAVVMPNFKNQAPTGVLLTLDEAIALPAGAP